MSAVPSTDISHMTEVPPPAPLATSPMASAVQLLKAGLTTEQLREMMQLQLQWEANEARKAYVEAMAEFKKAPPQIVKDTLVDFQSSKGRTTYKHATLGAVCDALVEALATHGFSHRWASRTDEKGITVTCLLTHRQGHTESYEMGPGKPDESGGKNAIQAIASTTTYFQRYSLLGITGLTTNDMRDDDGQGGPAEGEPEFRLREWVEKLAEAPDMAELTTVRDQGLAVIKRRGDTAAYEVFKKAYQARRKELDPAKTAEREPGAEG